MRKLMWMALSVLALTALPLGGADVAAQSKRPTVALLDFDFGTVQQWWSGNWDIGKGIADLLVDELVNDGSYPRHRAEAARRHPGRAELLQLRAR